jgi:uncharacterized protein YhaN
MRGPTLSDDYYALEARYDELLGECNRLAEDNAQLLGERDDAYALLRECLQALVIEAGEHETCVDLALLARIREVLP